MNSSMRTWLWVGLAMLVFGLALTGLLMVQRWQVALASNNVVWIIAGCGYALAFLLRFHQVPWVGRFGYWVGVLVAAASVSGVAFVAGYDDLGWVVVGAAGLFLLADWGLRLARWSLRAGHPVLAVAGQVLDEAVHMRLTRWIILFIAGMLALLAAVGGSQERLDYQLRFFLSWSQMGSMLALGALTLCMGCFSVAGEYAGKQLHVNLSKPVSRFGYLAGKWLGVMTINGVLLTLIFAAIWGGSQLIVFRYGRESGMSEAKLQREHDAARREVLAARTPRPASAEPSDSYNANFVNQLRANVGTPALSSNSERITRIFEEAARAGRQPLPMDFQPYLTRADWEDLNELSVRRWMTLGTPRGQEATEPSQTYVFHGLHDAAARGEAARARALKATMKETGLPEAEARTLLFFLTGRIPDAQLTGPVLDVVKAAMKSKEKSDALRAIRAAALAERLQLRLVPQASGELPRPGYVELRIAAGGTPLPPVTEADQQALQIAGVPDGDIQLGARLLPAGQSTTIDIPFERIETDGRLVIQLTRAMCAKIVTTQDGAPAVGYFPQPTITFELADGIVLYSPDGGFGPNLARALGVMAVKLGLLAMLAVVTSAIVSFPIACLMSVTLFAIFALSGWLNTALAEYVTLRPAADTMGRIMDARHDVIRVFGQAVLWVLPDFGQFETTEKIVDGQTIGGSLCGRAAAVLGLWTLGVLGVGGWLFHRREIARVVV